jgi:catechol 2,3-dioxygenase-like lactoylglutathione lyase family enzyme
VRGVNHIALVTRDLGRLSAFYADALGAEPAYERSESDRSAGLAFLRIGAVVLHIFERPGDSPGGVPDERAGEPFARGRVDHVAYEASDADEFSAIRDRLIVLGATTGEVVDFGVLVSLFATDPDGAQVEISLPRPPDWHPPFELVPPPKRR